MYEVGSITKLKSNQAAVHLGRTRMIRTLAVVAVAIFTTLVSLAPSYARDWEKLGERVVNFALDRDVIPVGRSEGRFKRIKLIVRDNAVVIESLKVIYGNGVPEELPVRSEIRAGGETRAIDLSGNARVIREVQLVYRSVPNFRGRAVVEVWGLQD
jgi:hypothetical protein